MRLDKMNRQLLTLVVIFTASCSTIVADNSVHILGKFRQSVTSSTLNWLPIGHYDKSRVLVVGGFYEPNKNSEKSDNEMDQTGQDTKQKPLYVCRVRHNGVYVAGSQLEGEKNCTVTFLTTVQRYENYDLLENVENAARLSWLRWDKFHPFPPIGAVATDTLYVARYPVGDNDDNKNGSSKTSPYTHYIGTLHQEDTFGQITYVKDDGKEASVNSGELLVETEPQYYQLTDIAFNKWRKKILKSEEKIIAQEIIKNTRHSPANFAQELEYKYKYLSYWGHRPAMIKALNTSLLLKNRTQIGEISWGMEEKSEREDVYKVEIYLEPGTAVNLTLRGNYTEYEIPYTGQLVSHYQDGESTTRPINGIRKEETMMDLKPEAGPHYFLSNMSIVPTTLPPPTTTKTTTTTTTEKSTTTTIKSSSVITTLPSTITTQKSLTDDQDDNMIVPKNNGNIQNDDGGPLSLKNRDREANNAAAGYSMTLCLPILLSIITLNLYRIT